MYLSIKKIFWIKNLTVDLDKRRKRLFKFSSVIFKSIKYSKKKPFQKIRKKNFFWKNFTFVLKNTLKSKLQFFAAHWSAICSTVSRLAVLNRKIKHGDFDSFIVKISWGENLHFYGKRRKTSTFGSSGTNGLSWILSQNSWEKSWNQPWVDK